MRMCHNAMQAFQWLLAAVLAQSGPIADIRPLLSAQGFQWTLVKQDSEIEYIGDISQVTRIYSVYLYNAVNRTNLHGINFFVVILNRTKYLGVYDSLSAHDCHIEEQTVACKTDYPGNRFEFTKQGPPQEIWIDGANSPFERPPNSDSRARVPAVLDLVPLKSNNRRSDRNLPIGHDSNQEPESFTDLQG